jgi:Fe-S cluster assembly iron-binding protein IscA
MARKVVQMKIKISDAGMEYLKRKQYNSITLEIKTSGGGCCPTFESDEIYFKEPQNIDNYNVFEVSDISVYVDKKAKVIASVLQFDVEKLMFFTKLTVSGLALKKHD